MFGTFWKNDDFLSSILKNEICKRRFRVEHAERELVLHFLAVELLGIFEQVDESINIVGWVLWVGHHCIGLHLP